MKQIFFYADAANAGQRIDRYISEQSTEFTRSAVQKLLSDEQIHISGKPVKKNYKICGGETIVMELPAAHDMPPKPQDLPLDIVYEDDDLLVVNKARGMVVHPAAGNWEGTLVNALRFHCGDQLSDANGEIRPGIVHRIDKDTSGLLVVAKTNTAHIHLAQQIQIHAVRREYEAIVCGTVRDSFGVVNQPIGRQKENRKRMAIVEDGRHAVTHYKVLERYAGYTYMQFRLETGRTHQIRVHMASMGHPIIGDPLYGRKRDRFASIGGQCLHARRLQFVHPRTGQEMEFYAPRPEYFDQIIEKLARMT